MFSFYEHIESDIILELTINSALEICDKTKRISLKGWSLQMTILKMHLNATHYSIYMQQFVELIPWRTQRHITAWHSLEMILEMIYSRVFHTVLRQKWGNSTARYFHVLAEFGRFLLYECAAGVSSHSPVSEVPPMWIPVPWHRFLYLSGAAAARAPSAWLISFILVSSKEARGVGKGASIAALLVQTHRSLSCAVWQPGTRMCE